MPGPGQGDELQNIQQGMLNDQVCLGNPIIKTVVGCVLLFEQSFVLYA